MLLSYVLLTLRSQVMDESKKKRPRGRAPHGRFNVAKIWNEETGEWDEDPRTAPPAQGNVKAAAEAAEEEAADLTSERDKALEKVARLPTHRGRASSGRHEAEAGEGR